MLFLFPIFTFSECQLELTYSGFTSILNITDFESCTESANFGQYSSVSAVSFSKTDSTFENEYTTTFFMRYYNVNTVMFEGNVEELTYYLLNSFIFLNKVIFYRNVYSIGSLALGSSKILHYYGSVVPTYGGRYTDLMSIQIHVSNDYPAEDFLGVWYIQDLKEGYVIPPTPYITPFITPLQTLSTTPLRTLATTPLITLAITPLSTPSTTPNSDSSTIPDSDSSTSSTTPESQNPDDSDKSEVDNGEPDKSDKSTIIIIVVVSVLVVIGITTGIIFYVKKHRISEESVLSEYFDQQLEKLEKYSLTESQDLNDPQIVG